jgi:hypothetical protein
MRFFMRWIIIGLPLLWPAIGHAQLMDENAEKPKAEGGDPVGAWMADSTALPVWADPKILNIISDESIDGTVSGSLKLKADSGTYEADYVISVNVKLTVTLLRNFSLDSTFVVERKEEGSFEVKDANLILEHTPEDAEMAVRDTLGFSVREDSLFVLQVVPLPAQFAPALAMLGAEAPLAVMGFAKVEEEPDPDPDPPEPGVAADFNGDGSVDFSDFISFAQNFGRSEGDANFDARFDLSGDGSVDFSDFIAFAQQFGQ